MSERFIPDCVVEDILLRLPPKSIARFRCVSKSWQTQLTNPSFAAIKFQRAMANPNNNLLKLLIYTHDCELFCLDSDDISQSILQYAYHKGVFTIFGSCNGRICLRAESTHHTYMLNPYTHEESKVIHLLIAQTGYGFGYSSTRRDYEVLGISKVDDAMGMCLSEVTVFSLNNNNQPARVQYIPYHINNQTKKGEFVNGALHWMAVKRRGGKIISNILIAYNMNTEEFKEIPLPYIGYEIHNRNMTVGVLQDYLCVSSNEVGQGKVEIWVMIDYKKKESWTLLFNNSEDSTRQLIRNPVMPLFPMNKGKEILLVDQEELPTKGLKFYLYDRDSQCARKFDIHSTVGRVRHAITCMKTGAS